MGVKYGTLKNATVTIDGDGIVWLWIGVGHEHMGINLSGAISEPSIDETLKKWARQQEPIKYDGSESTV